MPKEKMHLEWEGTFIELCTSHVTREQKRHIDTYCPGLESAARFETWYENASMLKAVFAADNWWSVDDLDHVMGLVFADRTKLDFALEALRFDVAGTPVTVDPHAIQLSFYAPEAFESVAEGDQIVRHGAKRKAHLHLDADFVAPFDPSLLTLSFIDYPETGLILIDLDYDGHDDVEMSFGEKTYLPPQFIQHNVSKRMVNDDAAG